MYISLDTGSIPHVLFTVTSGGLQSFFFCIKNLPSTEDLQLLGGASNNSFSLNLEL